MAVIVKLQFGAALVVALIALLIGGRTAAISALLGGFCYAIPNALFAARLFFGSRRPNGANPMDFFIGEFIKIALAVSCIGLTVWLYRGVNWLAFFAAFIVVLHSYFILIFRRPS